MNKFFMAAVIISCSFSLTGCAKFYRTVNAEFVRDYMAMILEDTSIETSAATGSAEIVVIAKTMKVAQYKANLARLDENYEQVSYFENEALSIARDGKEKMNKIKLDCAKWKKRLSEIHRFMELNEQNIQNCELDPSHKNLLHLEKTQREVEEISQDF